MLRFLCESQVFGVVCLITGRNYIQRPLVAIDLNNQGGVGFANERTAFRKRFAENAEIWANLRKFMLYRPQD